MVRCKSMNEACVASIIGTFLQSAPAMSLPAPGLFEQFVLINPRLLATLLIGSGIIAWFVLRYRNTRKALIVAGSSLGAAVLIVTLAIVIETPAEIVRRQTGELVDHVLDGRSEPALALLADDVRFEIRDQDVGLSKPAIALLFPLAQQGVITNSISTIEAARLAPGSAASLLSQRTRAASAQPVPNEWRFDWTRNEQGQWVIQRIRWMSWDGREPSMDLWRR